MCLCMTVMTTKWKKWPSNGLLACLLLYLQLSLECASFNLKLLIAVIEVKPLLQSYSTANLCTKKKVVLQHEMRR